MKFRARYVPSHSQRQMNTARARRGLKPSKMKAMDDFLMSDEVQDVSDAAAEDIAMEARAEAIEGGILETGNYSMSFDSERIPPVVAGGNPRRAAKVFNDDEAAPAVEFGNKKVGDGRWVLTRAGQKYHTPKGIA